MRPRTIAPTAMILVLAVLLVSLLAAMAQRRIGAQRSAVSPAKIAPTSGAPDANQRPARPACKSCKGERPDFEELAHFSPACNDARRVLHILEYLDRAWDDDEIEDARAMIEDPLSTFPGLALDEVDLLSGLALRTLGRRLASTPDNHLVAIVRDAVDHQSSNVRYNALEAALEADIIRKIPSASLDSALIAIEQSLGATLTHGLRSRLAAGMGRE